jgi:hypothetical protein
MVCDDEYREFIGTLRNLFCELKQALFSQSKLLSWRIKNTLVSERINGFVRKKQVYRNKEFINWSLIIVGGEPMASFFFLSY